MPRSLESLTLPDAKRMLAAAEMAAQRIGIPYDIAVVDAGGHLLAFVRQDGGLIGSIDLAIGKAKTARIYDKPTSLLATFAQPGAELYGIQDAATGVVIFGGGIPVVRNGVVIGAVGASSGSVDQDILVAEAAVGAISELTG